VKKASTAFAGFNLPSAIANYGCMNAISFPILNKSLATHRPDTSTRRNGDTARTMSTSLNNSREESLSSKDYHGPRASSLESRNGIHQIVLRT
jgi:hypothetical protein